MLYLFSKYIYRLKLQMQGGNNVHTGAFDPIRSIPWNPKSCLSVQSITLLVSSASNMTSEAAASIILKLLKII